MQNSSQLLQAVAVDVEPSLQLVFTSSLKNLAAAVHPFTGPSLSTRDDVPSKHAVLLQWQSKVSCRVWVAGGSHEVVCAACTVPQMPSISKPKTGRHNELQGASSAGKSEAQHVYHGHQVTFCC